MARTKKTTSEAPSQTEVVTAFKGFDKGFSCRGHKFEVGQTYTIGGKIESCSNGFHACENPFDVWSYYGPFESRFAVVELSGDLSRHSGDSKIAAAKITVQTELHLPDFIRRAVDWIVAATKHKADLSDDNNKDAAQIGSSGNDARIGSSGNDARIGSSGYATRIGSSGYDAQIGSSGYAAQIGSSGNDARIGSSGNDARIGSSGYATRIGSSGYDAQIGSSGYAARIGSSGNAAQIGSSGNDARIGSSGNDARIGSSGNDARIGSSGYATRIKSDGERGVIASAGPRTRAKGANGTWISLAEFDDNGVCVGFATGCIGQAGLAPDTWYIAKNSSLIPEE